MYLNGIGNWDRIRCSHSYHSSISEFETWIRNLSIIKFHQKEDFDITIKHTIILHIFILKKQWALLLLLKQIPFNITIAFKGTYIAMLSFQKCEGVFLILLNLAYYFSDFRINLKVLNFILWMRFLIVWEA